MCKAEDIKCRLISLAESIRAEFQFDLSFKIKASEFFNLKFKNDTLETINISNTLYKYNKNA